MRASIRPAVIQLYHGLDVFSGWLILLTVVLSPWLFGGTTSLPSLATITLFGCIKPWTIWVVNLACYLLGLLLVGKRSLLLVPGYAPPRLGVDQAGAADSKRWRVSRLIIWGVLAGSFLIMSYQLVSVLNARATYDPASFNFTYHPSSRLLPHSFDRPSSWGLFWNHLGLVLFFWSVWDWLQGGGTSRRQVRSLPGEVTPESVLPPRLVRLLWVLTLNGVLLGLVGICQRESGTDKILWLVTPRYEANAFGPYSYRANAAQYFNLVWPVALGLWWALHNFRKDFRNDRRASHHHWLIPCVVILAVCPILSGSRGGALITLINVVLAALVIFFSLRHSWGATKLGMFLFLLSIFGIGLFFGGDTLARRMGDVSTGYAEREGMFELARPMAHDEPVYGLGPGTFAVLFQFYRPSLDTYWPYALHNDWLETLITFGWVGSALIALTLGLVILRWVAGQGIPATWSLVAFFWIALTGCLVHARFDFPLQVHSILLLFLTLCAVLLSLARPAAGRLA